MTEEAERLKALAEKYPDTTQLIGSLSEGSLRAVLHWHAVLMTALNGYLASVPDRFASGGPVIVEAAQQAAGAWGRVMVVMGDIAATEATVREQRQSAVRLRLVSNAERGVTPLSGSVRVAAAGAEVYLTGLELGFVGAEITPAGWYAIGELRGFE